MSVHICTHASPVVKNLTMGWMAIPMARRLDSSSYKPTYSWQARYENTKDDEYKFLFLLLPLTSSPGMPDSVHFKPVMLNQECSNP